MKKKQKMRKVYYSHIEYGEVMIPDGLCGKEEMDYLLDLFERGKDFRVYTRRKRDRYSIHCKRRTKSHTSAKSGRWGTSNLPK